MPRLLITGGDGFIARSLTEALGRDFTVVAANRKMLDLCDARAVADFLSRRDFDGVIHAATYDAAPAFSAKDPRLVLDRNLRMFFNLVRCRDRFGKLIYFGSGAEFNKKHWQPKMKESFFDVHIPDDPYGFSKYIMTRFAMTTPNIINLRLFGVFGKYDDWRYRLIPNACCQAVLGLPLTLRRNACYDFLDAEDLARIVRWFVTHEPRYPIYNVCSGRVHSFRQLAEMIVEISGKALEIRIADETPGGEYSGDNSLLLEEMGEFDFTPIRSSIESLYRWYERNRNQIDQREFAIA